MSDFMREEFEKWFDESGFYKSKETAWSAWEASRECLVIDLDPDESADEGATYLHQDFVKDRIQSFGLKVKS